MWCVCACVRVCVWKRERATFVHCSFALPFLLHHHATRSCFKNLPCRNAIMIRSCHIAATNCARVGCAGLHRLWVCVCLLSVRVFACVYACVCVGVCVWGCVSLCVNLYVIVACPCLLSHTHKNHATLEMVATGQGGRMGLGCHTGNTQVHPQRASGHGGLASSAAFQLDLAPYATWHLCAS